MNQFTIAETALAHRLANVLLAASDNCQTIKRLAAESVQLALHGQDKPAIVSRLPFIYIAGILRHAVPQYAQPEDLPAAIKAVAGYAAEIACNKLEANNETR